jgi:hypothetical protein
MTRHRFLIQRSSFDLATGILFDNERDITNEHSRFISQRMLLDAVFLFAFANASLLINR